MDNKEKGSNNEKNEIRQIEIRIAQVMQIQDGRKREDCVKKIILDLQKILENEKYKEFYQKRNLVSGMNIDLSSKLRFLMLASKISYTCYENFGNDRILSILKMLPTSALLSSERISTGRMDERIVRNRSIGCEASSVFATSTCRSRISRVDMKFLACRKW